MASWPFVIAAYGVTIAATAALLLLSWRSLRNAEASERDLRERR